MGSLLAALREIGGGFAVAASRRRHAPAEFAALRLLTSSGMAARPNLGGLTGHTSPIRPFAYGRIIVAVT